MKLDKFFDEKTVIDLSFFNFSNAVTAAYFANRNLEVLRVNKNFKKFFPILKTVNNKNLKFDGVDGNFYFQNNLIERELGILQINRGQALQIN